MDQLFLTKYFIICDCFIEPSINSELIIIESKRSTNLATVNQALMTTPLRLLCILLIKTTYASIDWIDTDQSFPINLYKSITIIYDSYLIIFGGKEIGNNQYEQHLTNEKFYIGKIDSVSPLRISNWTTPNITLRQISDDIYNWTSSQLYSIYCEDQCYSSQYTKNIYFTTRGDDHYLYKFKHTYSIPHSLPHDTH